VQAGVVEVDQLVVVEGVDGDGGLDVLVAVGRAGGVGEPPAVDLDDERAALGDLRGDVRADRAVRLQLVDVDAVERLELVGPRLEEGELVALVIEGEGAAEAGQRLAAVRVEELDDDVVQQFVSG